MSRRHTVLHCITSLHGAGAQHMLLKLLSASDRKKFDSVVVALEDGKLRERFEALDVAVHCLGMRRGVPTPGALWKLVKVLRTVNPDVMLGWMYHANLALTLAATLARSRGVLLWNIRRSLYDIKEDRLLTRAVIYLNARLSRRPERILYCGEVIADQHEQFGFAPEKRLVIPNGFNLDLFRPNPDCRRQLRERLGLGPNTLLVGAVGRFHPQKDYHTLLRAVRHVTDSLSDCYFVLVGAEIDHENAILLSWIRECGVESRVHLLGEQSQVQQIMAGFDLFCLSSCSEGFPNVVGEAMASGVECVSTDAGAARDLIGDTGTVVERRDAEALAQALIAALSRSSEERARRGLLGRRRIEEKFSIARVVRIYEHEYAKCAGLPVDSGSANHSEIPAQS